MDELVAADDLAAANAEETATMTNLTATAAPTEQPAGEGGDGHDDEPAPAVPAPSPPMTPLMAQLRSECVIFRVFKIFSKI